MLKKDLQTSDTLRLKPHVASEPERVPIRLTAIDGAKRRIIRRSPFIPSLATNGLHLVRERASNSEQVILSTDGLLKAPVQIPVVNPGNRIVLRTILFVSLLCCGGVLAWSIRS